MKRSAKTALPADYAELFEPRSTDPLSPTQEGLSRAGGEALFVEEALPESDGRKAKSRMLHSCLKAWKTMRLTIVAMAFVLGVPCLGCEGKKEPVVVFSVGGAPDELDAWESLIKGRPPRRPLLSVHRGPDAVHRFYKHRMNAAKASFSF